MLIRKAITKFTVFLMVMLFCLQANAQFDFDADSRCYTPYRNWLDKIDSVYHLQKDNDFELRVWIYPARAFYPVLFTLFYRNNKWEARIFELVSKRNLVIPKEKILKNKNPERLWNTLKENHLLTVPDHQLLKDTAGNEAYPRVLDGVSYTFELLAKDKQKIYSYYCPKSASGQFPSVKEFVFVTTMIEKILLFSKMPGWLGC